MKVLIIADEEWNDFVFGNGVLTNWFSGFDAEFATIYCSPGLPINEICTKYFQITDSQMARTLIGRAKAGGVISKPKITEHIKIAMENAQRKGIYGISKKISLKVHTPILMFRDFIWCNGIINIEELRKFVTTFKPDVVFCPRLITPKLIRIERIVATITDAPFVAFTGDYEILPVPSICSFFKRIRTRYINKSFAKHVSLYSYYLMHSQVQADEYRKKYNIETSSFYKCGNFNGPLLTKDVGSPIKLVYAGRLYCNRWMALSEIGSTLQRINKDKVRMVLYIYTTEKLSIVQKKALNEEKYIYIKGCVSPSELKEIYKQADIALHVESMDEKNRLTTQFSFSTKIIDLMASSCAILAICWKKQTGFKYLKDHDAAFCVSEYCEIYPTLKNICNNSNLIPQYAMKAYKCGKEYHSIEKIQGQLRDVYEKVIKENKRDLRK